MIAGGSARPTVRTYRLTVGSGAVKLLGTMRSTDSAVTVQRRWQGAPWRSYAFFYAFGYGDPTPSGGDAAG